MAKNDHSNIPLYSLVRDWRLRQIFWRASRDLGDEFAVPVRKPTPLQGGAAASLELAKA